MTSANESRGYYFFLSNASAATTQETGRARADEWATRFFHQLTDEIRRLRPHPTMEVGFMDEQMPLDGDWQARASRALGSAQVLVPLYSPSYLARAWPTSVRLSFLRRLESVDPVAARRHVQPVLWVPLLPEDSTPESAVTLGEGIPEYRTNGMQAMCRLSFFHEPYRRVLARLAAAIVEVAEGPPLKRSSAPIVVEPVAAGHTRRPFIIGLLASAATDVPAGWADRYGDAAAQWRPYSTGRTLPVADIAGNVAQRLGFDVESADLWADANVMTRKPGIALVDPWIGATESGRERLADLVRALPAWAAFVIVRSATDPPDRSVESALIAKVEPILRSGDRHPVKYSQDASGLAELVSPLLNQARRRFLYSVPSYPPADGSTRQRPKFGKPMIPTARAPEEDA